MFLVSHYTEFIFRSLFDLLDVVLAFFISILITSKLWTQGYRYQKLRKTFVYILASLLAKVPIRSEPWLAKMTS